MQQTNLSVYNNHPYYPGGSAIKRALWYFVSSVIFKSGLFPINNIKVALLRLFGAQVGTGITIKPGVNIKYPWHLKVGDNTWIGERVWIDNLVLVTIGSNVCMSQGAMLQTGSHNYKKTTFDLITGAIILQDGVWIGCGAIINQGVTVASHAVLTSGSVANQDLEPYFIYQGNPAVKTRKRVIE
jgi:putative colanic acid biosynthesis acetyltransferase WcaF